MAEGPLRFLAIGDLPYSLAEHDLLARLLRREVTRGTPFLVHVGDFKSGSKPCTDESFARIARLFRSQPAPLVYTPGDNEWTDCRRDSAGAYDPQERLSGLRRVFFADPGVLRLHELGVQVTDPDYPENYHFLRGGALFATVHVVGSENNRLEGEPAALAEHEARTHANRRHLAAVTRVAERGRANAIVLLVHANVSLEDRASLAPFASFREALEALIRSYRGPVLMIHGDTHKYRFDQPLRHPESGEVIDRFYRLEVPGAPVVGGVWVKVQPEGEAKPFAVTPVYPDAQAELVGE
jgi:hypothetical protein